MRDLWAKLLRQWMYIGGFVFVSVFLSVIYLVNASPVYTANGSILIDPRFGQNPEDGGQLMPGLLMSDALTVDSELRVLTSREVTARTVEKLGLQADSEPNVSLVQKVLGIFRSSSDEEGGASSVPTLSSEELRAERQLETLRKGFVRGLKAQRAGGSFVIDISYTSPNLEFAPQAVNTLMQEYLLASSEQQSSRMERNQIWLSGRIEELGAGVRAAETAIAEFRSANDLLAPEGQLLPTEIALNAATEELIQLQGKALAIEVQVQQLSEQIASGDVESVQIPAEERTQALNEFDAKYAELLQQEQELLLIWDEKALVVQSLRQQKAQTSELIMAESAQIRDRLQSQAEAAKRQVSAIETVIENLRAQYGDDTQKTVELRSLEREAEAKRELYERLLEEYNSTSQLMTFDSTSARVIAWAVPPDKKSAPKSRQIVVLVAFASFVLAVSAVLLLDALDNSFRSQNDISRELGLSFLGVVPNFLTDKKVLGNGRPTNPAWNKRSKRWKRLSKAARLLDFAAVRPSSVTAETMRLVHVRLALQKEQSASKPGGMVVGFTSSVRDEGKTTTAFNFAASLARQNESVAILDFDLISCEMSRMINPVLPQTNRLANFVDDPEAALNKLAEIPEFPGLAIIGVAGGGTIRPSALRDHENLTSVIEYLRQHFDYIVIDLPPVQGAADTQLLARLCDKVMYVIKWGSTPKEQVTAALRQRGLRKDKIFGVLYTRANLRKYQSYNKHEINYY